jgi:TolB-like protein
LWGTDTFVDFEHGLHAAVNKLRAALNDAADHPRYIETIPRRGYRFVGAIDAGKPTAAAPSNQSDATAAAGIVATSTARWRPAFPLSYALVTMLFLAVGIALISFRATTTDSSTGSGSRLMLAVLPFENLSGDPEQEYFSDGLTEELITGLGQLDVTRLGVIARTSVAGYKRTGKPVRQISRELGVDYVLEGSVRHDNARIRVTTQLVRASDETHVWAGSYDRGLGDLLPVQTEIAQALAGELQLRLPGVDRSAPPGRHVGWEAQQAALTDAISWNSARQMAFARRSITSSARLRWSRPTPVHTSA